MTEQEAVERLKCMRLFMQINDDQNDSKFLEDDYIANEMAIEALEKQIPKKPIVKENQFFDCITGYSCPTCGNLLIGRARKYEYSYCYDCGQKLEWSDAKC